MEQYWLAPYFCSNFEAFILLIAALSHLQENRTNWPWAKDDKHYHFFINLLKKLDFVLVEETKDTKDKQRQLLAALVEAAEMVNMIKGRWRK